MFLRSAHAKHVQIIDALVLFQHGCNFNQSNSSSHINTAISSWQSWTRLLLRRSILSIHTRCPLFTWRWTLSERSCTFFFLGEILHNIRSASREVDWPLQFTTILYSKMQSYSSVLPSHSRLFATRLHLYPYYSLIFSDFNEEPTWDCVIINDFNSKNHRKIFVFLTEP